MYDPLSVKKQSEAAILADGGKICEWLGIIDPDELTLRDAKEIARRALVLGTLVSVSFGAPQKIALDWLGANDLLGTLSERESTLLRAKEVPDEQTKIELRWNVESLWSIAWIGNLFDGLTPYQSISTELASRLPNLRTNEAATQFITVSLCAVKRKYFVS